MRTALWTITKLQYQNNGVASVLENFKDAWNLLGSVRSAMAGGDQGIALFKINCQECYYVFCSIKDSVTGSRAFGPPLLASDNCFAR